MLWYAADEVHPACTSLAWLPTAVLALVSLILLATLLPSVHAYPPNDDHLLTAFLLKLYGAFIIHNHATTAPLVSQVHYPSIGSLSYQARHRYPTTSSHSSICAVPCLSYQAINSLTLMSHSWHNYPRRVVVYCCIICLVRHFFTRFDEFISLHCSPESVTSQLYGILTPSGPT